MLWVLQLEGLVQRFHVLLDKLYACNSMSHHWGKLF